LGDPDREGNDRLESITRCDRYGIAIQPHPVDELIAEVGDPDETSEFDTLLKRSLAGGKRFFSAPR